MKIVLPLSCLYAKYEVSARRQLAKPSIKTENVGKQLKSTQWSALDRCFPMLPIFMTSQLPPGCNVCFILSIQTWESYESNHLTPGKEIEWIMAFPKISNYFSGWIAHNHVKNKNKAFPRLYLNDNLREWGFSFGRNEDSMAQVENICILNLHTDFKLTISS